MTGGEMTRLQRAIARAFLSRKSYEERAYNMWDGLRGDLAVILAAADPQEVFDRKGFLKACESWDYVWEGEEEES